MSFTTIANAQLDIGYILSERIRSEYEEFKEALLRCAIYKWDEQSKKHGNKALAWKLNNILEAVVKLDPLDQIARRKKNAKLGIEEEF